MLNIEKELNEDQKKAVLNTEGPVLILAGAGSGKTRVITFRIAYLISLGISPSSILAVTFTNKAAEEMKKRVLSIVGPGAADVWLCTFHSLAAKILRIESKNFKINPDFLIYDTDDSKSLIKNCLKNLELDEKVFKPSTIYELISRAKDSLIDPESYALHAADEGEIYKKQVSKIYSAYQRELKKNSAFDFGDLIMEVVNNFKLNDEITKKYQHKFEYIMVDEYQDTNHAQYVLIKTLVAEKKNICVVGDDDQSIYSWRGADISNILSFEKDYTDTFVVKLGRNYRSSENILKAAAAVIKNNNNRKEKMLWTAKTGGENTEILNFDSEVEEATGIANTIYSLVNKNEDVLYKDFAIFYRTNAQSRVLEDALRRLTIPYRIYGNIKFYERKEIKDIISYISVAVNPDNYLGIKRIINTPARGIGKETIKKLEDFARINNMNIISTIGSVLNDEQNIKVFGSKTYEKLKVFYQIITDLKEKTSNVKPSDVISFVIDKTGYIEELKDEKTLESEARIENLEELVSAVKEFENREQNNSIMDFLHYVSLISQADEVKDDNFVTLMTLHLAKGLEFNTVFMTGMEEGIFPHVKSKLISHNCEEERRLCYVGMTRAKQKLYLTYSNSRKIFGNESFNEPSRFLKESGIINESNSNLNKDLFGFINEKKTLTEENERKIYIDDNSPFKKGDFIKHSHFGIGKVIYKTGAGDNIKIDVIFEDGKKKTLLIKYAKIEKV